MPRYYFHRTDGFVDNDPDGIELPNLSEARLKAVRYAGECLMENPGFVGGEGQEFRIEVGNDSGQIVLSLIVQLVAGQAQTYFVKL